MPKTENKTHPETASDADTENGRLYRIYASAGNPLDSGTYRFVAEFARRKAAEKYAKYIQKKKRFSDKSILIKEVLSEEPAAEEGELVVVLSPLGELPAPKKENIGDSKKTQAIRGRKQKKAEKGKEKNA